MVNRWRWRWIFWVNLPVGFAVIMLVSIFLKAKSCKTGKSLVEEDRVDTAARLMDTAAKNEVRLVLPDLVPLPLRLRKAVLAPLEYTYLHKEIRLVRDFDLRMARESHRRLEEIPGWWDDERIHGTPLLGRISDPADPARAVLGLLRPDPWIEPPAQIRFISRRRSSVSSLRAANSTPRASNSPSR